MRMELACQITKEFLLDSVIRRIVKCQYHANQLSSSRIKATYKWLRNQDVLLISVSLNYFGSWLKKGQRKRRPTRPFIPCTEKCSVIGLKWDRSLLSVFKQINQEHKGIVIKWTLEHRVKWSYVKFKQVTPTFLEIVQFIQNSSCSNNKENLSLHICQ